MKTNSPLDGAGQGRRRKDGRGAEESWFPGLQLKFMIKVFHNSVQTENKFPSNNSFLDKNKHWNSSVELTSSRQKQTIIQ